MLKETEIQYIADLARIKLSAEEKSKLQGELTLILDFVEQLKELPVDNVTPTASASGAINITRPDLPAEQAESGVVEAMLKQVPEQKDGFIKVKAILK